MPQPTEAKPDVLTAEEAAQVLRVHTQTIKRWLADGKLKGIKIGRAWRVSRAEITRILEGGTA
jgi:acetyl-CoA synthetase